MRTAFSPDQQREVLEHLRSCNRVKAIVAIRRFTDLDLKGAMAAIAELENDIGPAELYAENHMGMTADVIAVGRFSPAIITHMEYPAKFYADTREGAPIVRVLFEVYEGSTRSRELAACFGIDAWDFNEHQLDAQKADLKKLRDMFGEAEVAIFEALRDAGFSFYFRPNG